MGKLFMTNDHVFLQLKYGAPFVVRTVNMRDDYADMAKNSDNFGAVPEN